MWPIFFSSQKYMGKHSKMVVQQKKSLLILSLFYVCTFQVFCVYVLNVFIQISCKQSFCFAFPYEINSAKDVWTPHIEHIIGLHVNTCSWTCFFFQMFKTNEFQVEPKRAINGNPFLCTIRVEGQINIFSFNLNWKKDDFVLFQVF